MSDSDLVIILVIASLALFCAYIHPYRRYSAWHNHVRHKIAAVDLPTPEQFAAQLIERCCTDYPHTPPELIAELAAIAVQAMEAEDFPTEDKLPGKQTLELAVYPRPMHTYEKPLVDLSWKLDHVEQDYEAFFDAFVSSFSALLKILPPTSRSPHPTGWVPLLQLLPQPGQVMTDMIHPFFALQKRGFYQSFMEPYIQRCGQMTGGKGYVNPNQFQGSPDLLPQIFLEDTPWADLFAARLPYSLTIADRLEHMAILAPTRWGKSQLLKTMFVEDIAADDPSGMVVLDSKGDMVEWMAKLDVFHPDHGRLKDRIIFVDAKDEPSFNPFASKPQGGSRQDHQQMMNGVTNQMEYFFSEVMGNELSSNMGMLFRSLAYLMFEIPDPSLRKMIEAVDSVADYAPLLPRLPEGVQTFFNNVYPKLASQTKEAVKARLSDIMTHPAIGGMFSGENRLDLAQALNEGKIILVNLDTNFLEEKLSTIIGKYFIALTVTAGLRRQPLDRTRRKPTFLVIDEAGPLLDAKVDQVLRTLSGYGVGCILAFQQFSLAPHLVQESIKQNTKVKLAAGNLTNLAAEMCVNSAFIQSQRTQRGVFGEFACHVSGQPRAVSLRVIYDPLDHLSAMDDAAYQRMREKNRERLSAQPKVTEHAPPPFDNDDMSTDPK